MLVVPGGRPLSGKFGENTGTCAVKTVWRVYGNDIQQQEGAPGVTPTKGAERPSTALGRGQRGLGPMLGEDGR